MEFSPNLNVIIGGRSSGKSLLFSILGDKIDVNFNQNDDELSLESISIPTEGDIDFNSLVKTLINLIGKEKKLEFEFQEESSNPKNRLIKETLEDIYTSFNKIMIKDQL